MNCKELSFDSFNITFNAVKHYNFDLFGTKDISKHYIIVDFYNFQMDWKNQLPYCYLVWPRRKESRHNLQLLHVILNPYK
jgi:hypothetical protein